MEGVIKTLHGFALAGRRTKATDRNDEFSEKLRRDLDEVSIKLRDLEENFNCIRDDELIDAVIYEQQALMSRYRYLIRLAKENNISCKGELLP